MKNWKTIIIVLLVLHNIVQQVQISKMQNNLNILNDTVINLIDYVQNN